MNVKFMGGGRAVLLLGTMLLGATPAAAGTWQALTNGANAFYCGMNLLTDGSVIVHGLYHVPSAGCDGTVACSIRFFPDINGSYVDGRFDFSKTAVLPGGYNPLDYASAVLPDGRLIYEGGECGSLPCSAPPDFTNLGAIYDPVANSWTSVAPPDGWSTIGGAPGVVLSNGTFMIGRAYPREATEQALLDASSLTWTVTGAGKADGNYEEGWTLLPGGDVLAIDTTEPRSPTAANTAQRYDHTTGSWVDAGSTGVTLTPNSEIGPQVLRPDGSVLVFGAMPSGPDHTAIYDSLANSWTTGPHLPAVDGQTYTMVDGPAALLPNGKVFFAASPSPGHGQTPTHFFATDGNSIERAPDPENAAVIDNTHTQMLVLPTGQILVSFCGSSLPQIYTPSGRPKPQWAPVITAVPADLVAGGTYRVKGYKFNGFSQGAMFGDDWQMATNYPLVRIVNDLTGHVFYARTFGHNSMRVNAERHWRRALPDHTHFTVPDTIEPGPAQLFVVANGIPSQPAQVVVH